jgi:hypothetical protein
MKSGPRELARYRAEMIDPTTNTERKGKQMTREPDAPWVQLGITVEEWNERQRILAETLAATPTAQPDAPAGRKTRSDAGKPRPVKPVAAVQPTNDAAKRKHLALVEKYYGLLDKKKAIESAIDEVVAEINAHFE